jgi:transposase
VGFEACGSAHHWARELIKLGHDAHDASGLCEAVRPSAEERRVGRVGDLRGGDAALDAICRRGSLENQATLMRHKTREMLVSQRTRLLNALRGHLSEVGVIAAQGFRHGRELAELIEACDETISFEVCEALAPLVVQLRNLDEAIARLDRTIAKLAQKDETARRLMSIPGFGPITASAMAAISNCTGLEVFCWTTIARAAIRSPREMSRTFSLSRSQARNLLSMPRLNSANSRVRRKT